MAIKLFGFTIVAKDVVQKETPEQASFTLPSSAQLDDGAVTITQNAYYGTYVDLEGSVRNEIELITRYREMSNHPECEMAINEIVNEAITHDKTGRSVDIILDNLNQPESIKKKIKEEFENVLKMLNFGNLADDLFKRWYIDGRMYFHVIVNEKNPKEGIKELRYIDPRKIRKIKNVLKQRNEKGVEVVKSVEEFYLYNDKGINEQTAQGVKMTLDSVIYCPSGLIDPNSGMTLGNLHKAVKPTNQLKMIEVVPAAREHGGRSARARPIVDQGDAALARRAGVGAYWEGGR